MDLCVCDVCNDVFDWTDADGLLVCLGSQAPPRGERREQMALSRGGAELAED